jgi:hypothetical protein
MGSVALLGDSVFDNAAYVPAGEEVASQLRRSLPQDWGVTLGAVDGAVLKDIPGQLQRIPNDVTHLVVSAGGNDALRYSAVISDRVGSVGEALLRIAVVRDAFAADYRAMLGRLAARNLPTALCTIYDPNYADPEQQRAGATGLAVLNDVITREAVLRRLTVIDLRVLFSDASSYANAIEPSTSGGRRLAEAITRFVTRSMGNTAAFFGSPERG